MSLFNKMRRYILERYFRYKYRNHDDDVCCCGCLIGAGGSICHHGGCRSMKEYVITSETNRVCDKET